MQRLMILLLSCLALDAGATGRKDCAELRDEIATRIEARGVRDFRLEIVDAEAIGEQRVVGSCEGGSRRITYLRLPAPTPAAAAIAAVDQELL